MQNCPKCGNPVGEEAAYCGACGASLVENNSNYTVYNYSAKVAKQNKAYVTFGKIYGKALLFMVPVLVVAIICPIIFGDDMTLSLGLPIGLSLLGLAGIIVFTVKQAPFMNAAQQTLVYDQSRKIYYWVRFHSGQINGWNTASRAAAVLYNAQVRNSDAAYAQRDALCVQLVEEYQQNLHQPSAMEKHFWGTDFSVIELKNLKVIKKTQKSTTCAYTDTKSRSKKVMIPNVYPNLHLERGVE